MPFIEISVAEGRTEEQLRDLMQRVHDAVVEWGSPAESIRVLVREVPPTLWLAGGETLAEKRGLITAEGPSSPKWQQNVNTPDDNFDRSKF